MDSGGTQSLISKGCPKGWPFAVIAEVHYGEDNPKVFGAGQVDQ